MNIKRYKSYVKNKEFAEFIEERLKEVGWTHDEFWMFLEHNGVKKPIKIRELNKEKNFFKCLTTLDEEVEIVFGKTSVLIRKN